MSRNRDFERRAREEVARIKALEAEEEERKQARMEELAEEARWRREEREAEEARRKEEREAKLIRDQEDKAAREERMAKHQAWLSWKAMGGSREAFDESWTSMWQDMLRSRTICAEHEAREAHRFSSISRI